MEVIYGIEGLNARGSDPVVTMGTFDGVHLGHQAIIKEVEKKSAQSNRRSMLITFEPHPQLVVAPETAPLLLTTLEEKLDILSRTDLSLVLIIPFTKEFSQMNYRDFIENILVKRVRARELVVGYDHAFGKNREGRLPALKGLGKRYGFEVHVVSPVEVDRVQISSTTIRNLVTRGDMNSAFKLLGRFYSLRGWVVGGDERGHILNYPTANLKLNSERKLCPADGVYAVWVKLKGRFLPGVMNIGRRPTFDSGRRTIEVHLLDFHENIYGAPMEVNVVDRIREERKFNSQVELVNQIEEDKREATRILTQRGGCTQSLM